MHRYEMATSKEKDGGLGIFVFSRFSYELRIAMLQRFREIRIAITKRAGERKMRG